MLLDEVTVTSQIFLEKFQYDYNESLNLCDLLSCFHIIIVYFSFITLLLIKYLLKIYKHSEQWF